jgi:hypothetical protein
LAPLAVAQQELYRPPLGDIMGKIQLRHIKLWFAGKARNWELATYEGRRDQGQASRSAADLYRGIPARLVTNTADPIRSDSRGDEAKDSAAFAKGYGERNPCLQRLPPRGSAGATCSKQKPTASPFTDQSNFARPSA